MKNSAPAALSYDAIEDVASHSRFFVCLRDDFSIVGQIFERLCYETSRESEEESKSASRVISGSRNTNNLGDSIAASFSQGTLARERLSFSVNSSEPQVGSVPLALLGPHASNV